MLSPIRPSPIGTRKSTTMSSGLAWSRRDHSRRLSPTICSENATIERMRTWVSPSRWMRSRSGNATTTARTIATARNAFRPRSDGRNAISAAAITSSTRISSAIERNPFTAHR